MRSTVIPSSLCLPPSVLDSYSQTRLMFNWPMGGRAAIVMPGVLRASYTGHLMERIEKDGMLHRAFSVFLFDSQNRLMLQV